MNKTRLTFWIATCIIFLLEGVMPALTGHTEMAKEGVLHLGYPDYFRVFLNMMKVAGALTLVVPFAPKWLKEWAYAGFTFSLIGAVVSHYSVDGMAPQTFFPLVVLGILMASTLPFSKEDRKPSNPTDAPFVLVRSSV
ncbi:MAG: DoxX family protein [Bacteroidota bacterium]